MKSTILTIMIVLAAVMAVSAQSITFRQMSSAYPSTPNLRIGFMYGPLQVAPGTQNPPIQAGVVDAIKGYYFTKTITVNISSLKQPAWILVQPTNDVYWNWGTTADLVNNLLITGGDKGEGIVPRY